MKRTFSFLGMLLLGLLLPAWAQQAEITINGKVQFVGGDNKVIVTRNNGFENITLAETDIKPDKTYSLTVPANEAGIVYVTCCKQQRVRAWLEDEDMTIHFRGIDTARIRIMNPPYIYIQGGPKNELINLSNFVNHRDYQSSIASSQAIYSRKELADSTKQALYMRLYEASGENTKAYTRYLIEHNSHLTSCVALLSTLKYEKDSLFIKDILKKIDAANPGNTVTAKYLAKEYDRMAKEKKMEAGQPAPQFSFPDANGKMVSLSDYKGKVVIIDFWASWCGPCRAEIPKLKKIYEEFKDNKKVAFLSVSIDSKREAWEKAMAEEQMEWTQLLAPNTGREAMDKYQFRGIPFIVAIDQDGKIFRKYLRGDAVRQAIVDALKSK
ncbi:MAG: redoxin domain-containing protein [Bacteroides sp.]|nr:redoxin domain-containing protein [Bacteroides sp.]